MPVISYTENLEVYSSCIINLFFIFGTMNLYFILSYFTIRNINICRVYIYMVEQMELHEPVIALKCIFVNWIIFIKIKSDNVLKTKSLYFMQSYKLCI